VKAVRYYGKEDIRVEEVTAPSGPGPKQIVVRPKVCGICGTDLHEYAAGPIVTPVHPHHFTPARQLPQILGHEFSAEVIEVGKEVTRLRKGEARLDPAAGDAARRLLQPARPQPSQPQDGVYRPVLGLGRHG